MPDIVVVLYAPSEYWLLSKEDKKGICNGCGSKGLWGLGGWLVPDRFLLLDMSEACNIHDYMVYKGVTIEDKWESERVFLNNCQRIIKAAENRGTIIDKALAPARRKRALFYYNCLRFFGGPAFWRGKNSVTELGKVNL